MRIAQIFGLARPHPRVTWEDMLPVMQREAAHVWSLNKRWVQRDAWVRTDELGVVYVLETTPVEAERLLADQPLADRGLVRFELVPVGPFTLLSLLFGTQYRPIPPAAHPSARDGRCERVLALNHLRAGATLEDLTLHLGEEASQCWALCKGGVIRENYRRTDRPGAALMLEVAGVDEARAVLDELRLVRSGLIEFECLSLAAFVGFDALLDGALDEEPQQLVDPTRTATR